MAKKKTSTKALSKKYYVYANWFEFGSDEETQSTLL